IMMPKVDGLQLLERLKQDERYRDLPVLMVSSMPPEEATVRALGLGAADFISKPFRVRELLARVEAHIRVGRALAQAWEERRRWEREEIKVPTRSAVALPFWMKEQQIGVFFLRTTGDDPPLTRADAQFAETVIKTAVSAIEKAYDFESAVSDKQRLEKLASTDALTGCMNRRALAEALAGELDRARRYNLALTIMLAD